MDNDIIIVTDRLMEKLTNSKIKNKDRLIEKLNTYKSQGIVSECRFGDNFQKQLKGLGLKHKTVFINTLRYNAQFGNKKLPIYGFCDISDRLKSTNDLGLKAAEILLKDVLTLQGYVRIDGVDIVFKYELHEALKNMISNK